VFDQLPSVGILVVSYDDKDVMQKVLEEQKIEVVLSTISPANPTSFDAQVRLINACADSDSVKRFAPSEWLLDFEKKDEYVLIVNICYQEKKIKETIVHAYIVANARMVVNRNNANGCTFM
jgi:hypothetical protein